MKIGDLVRDRYNNYYANRIGVIVSESVLESAKEINRMYKVLWQDGDSYLHERVSLEVIKGGNNGNAK